MFYWLQSYLYPFQSPFLLLFNISFSFFLYKCSMFFFGHGKRILKQRNASSNRTYCIFKCRFDHFEFPVISKYFIMRSIEMGLLWMPTNSSSYWTFLIITFLSLARSGEGQTGALFYTWVASLLFSTFYTLFWDIRMDWGLLDKNAGENLFLREQIVYDYKVRSATELRKYPFLHSNLI